jgi:hypothetical protein
MVLSKPRRAKEVTGMTVTTMMMIKGMEKTRMRRA